jgi:uncharacterized repeat protein (TIGR03803 family)
MHFMRRVPLWVVGFALLVALVTVSPLALAQAPLNFVAVTPCRVVDTRWAPGPFGGPPLQRQTPRDFALPDGNCSIPNTAIAYSLNVTVVPHVTLGYLTVWPAGQPRPTLSTLNSLDGRIKANAAIIPAGTNEAISVYATDTTDLVLDIDGYFVPATTTTLAFFPLTPCRVADTRWPVGPLGGPFLIGSLERIFPVLSSTCNIPDTAQAYSLNFAVIPHGGLGYLTVWPTGQIRPLVSTLNALTGTITANAALVPAGQQGAISVYPSSATDLVIDVDGYFAQPLSGPQPASGPQPLSLYTLTPCRVLDTRQGSGAFSGTIPVDVLTSACQVPSAQAYVLNATVVPLHGQPLGYLTLWPDAESKPVVSTLNALDGAITSNMAIVPTLNGSIDAYATTATDLVADIFSYFAPIEPLRIMNTALPSATLNYSYSTTLGATGGAAPYTWSLISGSLPPGLNLDPASGLISGTPTIADTYPFTLQVTDSQSTPATASAPLSITVNSTVTQLSIVTTSLPSGTQNATYGAMLAATGGLTPYTWSLTAGSLPAGLHLNGSTGAITGTPSGGGISSFTVRVTDSKSPPAAASAHLSITVVPAVPLSITPTSLPDGRVGVAYSATLTAVGGVYPYTWTITAGSLPNGLTLYNDTGVIRGIPTLAGTSDFTIKVADSETPPGSVTAPLSITIAPPLRTFTVMHSFSGPDGKNPAAPLVLGSDGNLWGTTYYGGPTSDWGTIFKITPSGTLTMVFPFSSPTYHGSNPVGMVQAGDGSFYGVTSYGGRGTMGTIFRLTLSSFDVLYNFCSQQNCVDGQNPAYLMQASDGNFYGMNAVGGSNGSGDFYQFKPNGTLTVRYSFNSGTSGRGPFVALVQGHDGQLYGTAPQGGAHNQGTVFKITSNGTFTLLHSFCSAGNCADGASPYAGLALGADGNFYGTTSAGGANNAGTVFKITPGGTLTTLYAFAGPDGEQPHGRLVQGSDGNFYGTTYAGGAWGLGTVFEITPGGTLTTLHSFGNGEDSFNPTVNLLAVASGYLYGTTYEGGSYNYGIVFSLSPPSQ